MRVDLYEIIDETARAEAQAIVDAWSKPTNPPWPAGTIIVERKNSHFDRDWVCGTVTAGFSRFHLVTLPNGGELIAMTSLGRLGGPDDHDKPWFDAAAPHVAWSFLVSLDTGVVWAFPRVCQMAIRRSKLDRGDNHDWIIPEIGLKDSYEIGKLSRPLLARTHVEVDGYGY